MSKITGRAKKFEGTAIDYVSIFNWSDGKCIAQVLPDASGAWEYEYFYNLNVGITYVADGCEPITHGAYEFTGKYSPLAMFQKNELGIFLDPSDLSTMFQDTAGTIPVTAHGQPVGLIRDLSGNNNHAIQSVAGRRPIYQTDGVDHWLRFNGGQKLDFSVMGITNMAEVTYYVRASSDVAATSDAATLPFIGSPNNTFWMDGSTGLFSGERFTIASTHDGSALEDRRLASSTYQRAAGVVDNLIIRSGATGTDLHSKDGKVTLDLTAGKNGGVSGSYSPKNSGLKNPLHLGYGHNTSALTGKVFGFAIVNRKANADEVAALQRL